MTFDQKRAELDAAMQAVAAAETALADAKARLERALAQKVADSGTGPLKWWDVYWGIQKRHTLALTEEDAKRIAAPHFRVKRWWTLTAVQSLA